MPAINEKQEILDGVVFSYVNRPTTFFYRVYDKDTQKYRSTKIKGATTLVEACRYALTAHDYLREKETTNNALPFKVGRSDRSQTPYSRLVDPLIDQYLAWQKERVDANLITSGTYRTLTFALGKHLREYLRYKKILRTSELKLTTFDDYYIFRSNASVLYRAAEIRKVGGWIGWLVKNEFIHPKLSQLKLPTQKITEEDLLANPAINPVDWEVITKALRVRRDTSHIYNNKKVHYWRTLFHTFCLMMKNTGMRPAELRHLQWRDIEVLPLTASEEEQRKSGTMNSALTDKAATCYIYIKRSKTKAQREVPAKVGRELRRWKDYVTEYLKSKSRSCLTLDCYIFGNPDNEWRPYAYTNFVSSWTKTLEPVRSVFKGHKFSDKPYTIYSMRSTYIEDNLLQEGGCDVFLLATICGHDVKILQKHYERINVRERAGELIQIPYGRSRGRSVPTSSLLSDDSA